jgi:hypothetical protein
MTIFYKNQGYDLPTTNLTTVLTISTSTVAILKEISVANDHNNTVEVNYFLNDFSASLSYKFFHTKVVANSNDNAISNALVLEEGDSLTFKAEGANFISGQISYALLTRSGENG